MQDLRPLLYEKIKLANNHLKGNQFNNDESSRLATLCEGLGIEIFNKFFETNVAKLCCPDRLDDAFPLDFGNKRNNVGDVKTYKSDAGRPPDYRGLFVSDGQLRVFKIAKELGYPNAHLVYINTETSKALAAEYSIIKRGMKGIMKPRDKRKPSKTGYYLKYDSWTALGDVTLKIPHR